MKRKLKIPLYVQILLGMVFGVIWGLIAVEYNFIDFTNDWIRPWGTIFIKALKLVAVPLVFLSLIKGITSMSDMAKLSSIGGKTILLYTLTTIVSISLGLFVANAFQPGDTFPQQQRNELLEQYGGNAATLKLQASEVKEQPKLQPLVDLVPDNIFKASMDNKQMLQVIFFAFLFGISMVLVGRKKVKPLKKVIDATDAVIIKIIDIIMLLAPYGTFALLAALIIDFSGDIALFKALGWYVLCVAGSLLALILIFYPTLIMLLKTVDIRQFFRHMLPVQLTAFSTSSSAATLPLTLSQATEKLDIPENVAEFVLPVGVTINMDGTGCYQAIAAVFIAQVMGIDLTLADQIAIVLTALASSIGTPGIPGGSIIMLTVILSSAGIPMEGIALILGVDRLLDMCRTVVNVTGDMTIASILGKFGK
ncbi:Na+/H+-dicarboxylate symporter [Balneicella halophila]|uniref:Na+/H+-dicarboxylate symporter n=1 Tax=Balneicella halophila TaxID=1537566 RepID=A0A7L4UQY6_BALHA|nr:dicarboxylate/amino acid:cation symporter [Balneicella halophila]PVX52188.1 Na+/H+-dicarboxylate symporter [Balneicella halophila]